MLMVTTQLGAQETKLPNTGALVKTNNTTEQLQPAVDPTALKPISILFDNCCLPFRTTSVSALCACLTTPSLAKADAAKKYRSTQTGSKTSIVHKSKFDEPVIQEVNVYCTSKDTSSLSNHPEYDLNKKETDYSKLLEAIAKLLASVAWPISAVVIAYHFKNELAALLARLKKVKAGSAEAEFERHINEVIEASGIEETATPVSSSIRSAATTDPRGAVLAAWLEVEKALFELFDASGLNVPAVRPMRGILPAFKAIQKAGLLDSDYVSLFHDLRALRNDAAHNIEFNPSSDAVIRYTQLAKALTKALQDAANAQLTVNN